MTEPATGAEAVLTRQGRIMLGLIIAASTLLGGFLSFVLGISDRYVTKDLFEARMQVMEEKLNGTREVLSAQLDALRAEVKASGSSR